VSEPEQGIDIVSSAIREYFYHGREVFETKRKLLIQIVHDLGWDPYVKKSTFPSWDELVENWFKISEFM
jgi:hypothetical protein